MTREKLVEIMGEPEETFPYVEGKSLPHLKGRTSYEWSTPATMPAPASATVDDVTGKITSARCADAVITATVFVEPEAPAAALPTPAPELAPPPVSTTAVAAPPPLPARGPRERSTSNSQSSGRPLTQ